MICPGITSSDLVLENTNLCVLVIISLFETTVKVDSAYTEISLFCDIHLDKKKLCNIVYTSEANFGTSEKIEQNALLSLHFLRFVS